MQRCILPKICLIDKYLGIVKPLSVFLRFQQILHGFNLKRIKITLKIKNFFFEFFLILLRIFLVNSRQIQYQIILDLISLMLLVVFENFEILGDLLMSSLPECSLYFLHIKINHPNDLLQQLIIFAFATGM